MSKKSKQSTGVLTEDQLREYYERNRANQKRWGERYRAKQKLLRAKLALSGVEVTDEEIDAELSK